MTTTQRRMLLGFFATVFLLACPPIIAYSRGYRVAFSPFRVIRTGTLAIQSHPRSGEIWVDGKDMGKKTPEAVGGLKAGRYRVEVRKEGYGAWTKTLEVFPDLQTWASQVVLLPSHLPLQPVVQGGVLEFVLAPGGDECVFRTGVNPGQLQRMALEDGQGGPASPLAELGFLHDPGRHELEDFQWSPDSDRVLFGARVARRWSEKKGARTYAVVDLESGAVTALPLVTGPAAAAAEPTSAGEPTEGTGEQSAAETPGPPAPSPAPPPRPPSAAAWMGSSAAIAFSHGQLFEIRIPEMEALPIPLPEKALAYAVTGGERVVYLSAEEPVLRKLDIRGGDREDLMRIEEGELGPPAGDPEEPAGALSTLPRDRFLLLMRNGLLFVLDPVEGTIHHVAEGVEAARVSPDGKKLAYATRYGLGVYTLEVVEAEPRRLPNTRSAVTRSESRITSLAWHKLGEHVFYAAGPTVVFAELDDRGDRNSPEVASSPGALWGLDYDARRDILYLKRSRSKDPEGVFSVKISPEGLALLPLP